ncbi:hypothetical protein QP596_05590 [Cytobacillus oceanisediminis]|nr:hypothetical protein [Cytobacillus oceanisediminis]MDK7665288.1 hypothetical protein [Cytobacillus oceanisediminis]
MIDGRLVGAVGVSVSTVSNDVSVSVSISKSLLC